jgi:hypothetical protein
LFGGARRRGLVVARGKLAAGDRVEENDKGGDDRVGMDGCSLGGVEKVERGEKEREREREREKERRG